MQHRVVGQRGDDAAAQALMAHAAHPLVADDHPAVAPGLPARHAVAQKQQRLARHQLRLPQPRDDPARIDGRVGRADPALEVRLQV